MDPLLTVPLLYGCSDGGLIPSLSTSPRNSQPLVRRNLQLYDADPLPYHVPTSLIGTAHLEMLEVASDSTLMNDSLAAYKSTPPIGDAAGSTRSFSAANARQVGGRPMAGGLLCLPILQPRHARAAHTRGRFRPICFLISAVTTHGAGSNPRTVELDVDKG
ncbi:hypothetical protein BDN71DRAFT_1510157 [Pleurotus eryngii]|uniref:Uncharacterized protein n=1 Tax=Pleurotus eryngii TaxID=5323 RepID=A0A9P5ZQ84_PLEER|nr:hypothetical protein BDN71DRAFT_1510157 [Pleurotus eryngii]